jgi:predicted alpha/beta hydrolase family esterase
MSQQRVQVVLIPGLYDSGPEHWQSRWEVERPDCVRVRQQDWETPRCEDWTGVLEQTLRQLDGEAVLAAHSLACATVAHWAAAASTGTLRRVRGALLVAPSDVEAASYPPGTHGFTPMPRRALPFPSIVVASSDDAYVTPERAAAFARDWGSRLVEVGPRGHLNSASGLGSWPEGQQLLAELGATVAR